MIPKCEPFLNLTYDERQVIFSSEKRENVETFSTGINNRAGRCYTCNSGALTKKDEKI
jgi:hypothetical protein